MLPWGSMNLRKLEVGSFHTGPVRISRTPSPPAIAMVSPCSSWRTTLIGTIRRMPHQDS